MRYFTILLALTFSTTGLFAQESSAKRYSLEDCINYALEHSQDIEVAKLEQYISTVSYTHLTLPTTSRV